MRKINYNTLEKKNQIKTIIKEVIIFCSIQKQHLERQNKKGRS